MNSDLVERGLSKLEWLVVRDFAMSETANFWQKGRLIQRGELTPEQIGTEMFFLPAALSGEKDGTVTNTSRLVQWHDVVCEAPGDSRSDLWFIYHLGKRLKQLYADSTAAADRGDPGADLGATRERGERQEPDAEAVLREINGYTVADRKQVGEVSGPEGRRQHCLRRLDVLRHLPAEGHNVARSRKPDRPGGPGSHLGWAFAWPSNRRTLYNRASADPEGKPWSERKKMVWWDEAPASGPATTCRTSWPTSRPDYRPDWSKRPHGMDAHGGADPFIMEADGTADVRAVRAEGRAAAGPLRAGREPGAATRCTVSSITRPPSSGRGPATRCTRRPTRGSRTCSRPTA